MHSSPTQVNIKFGLPTVQYLKLTSTPLGKPEKQLYRILSRWQHLNVQQVGARTIDAWAKLEQFIYYFSSEWRIFFDYMYAVLARASCGWFFKRESVPKIYERIIFMLLDLLDSLDCMIFAYFFTFRWCFSFSHNNIFSV